VAAFVIFITAIGPEYVITLDQKERQKEGKKHRWRPAHRNLGSHFEKHKAAFEEGAADDDAILEDDLLEKRPGVVKKDSEGSVTDDEKKGDEVKKEHVWLGFSPCFRQ
jgi:hypothetical protein